MRVLKMVLVMSPLVVAAACGSDEPAADATLARDLAWLDSVATQPAQPQQFATPVELTSIAVPEGGFTPITAAKDEAKPAEEKETASEAPRRRSSSSRSRSSSASRSSSGSSGTYSSAPARQPRIVTKRNTARDAAIGAGAGAVIGAVAGGRRHRVRGAVIGAVGGAAAGAVIGSTVDVQRRVEY